MLSELSVFSPPLNKASNACRETFVEIADQVSANALPPRRSLRTCKPLGGRTCDPANRLGIRAASRLRKLPM